MRSTEAVINERVSQVYKWLLWYWPRHEIVAEGAKLWGVSERAVDEYISGAKQLIYDDNKLDRVTRLKQSISSWEDYIKRCIAAKDNKNEAIGRKQLDKITGIENYYDQVTNGNKVVEIKLVEHKSIDKTKDVEE